MNRQKAAKKRRQTVRRMAALLLMVGFLFTSVALGNLIVQNRRLISAYNAESFALAENQNPAGITALAAGAESICPAKEPAAAYYPIYPKTGEEIGSLAFPTLDAVIPIIQGTAVPDLEKGIGHYLQSVLPGETDNCVLAGHRDTVFRRLGELKIGDLVIIRTSAGTFTYEVTGTRVVAADDLTVIMPTDHAVLTMSTCYPFNTPGYYPERYIVSADLSIDP
ncbi:MAG: class D sortase [Negativicutes bacterium]|nr:class D sortase [Negativicutes bacterium]